MLGYVQTGAHLVKAESMLFSRPESLLPAGPKELFFALLQFDPERSDEVVLV
jgi:hypothetical protein